MPVHAEVRRAPGVQTRRWPIGAEVASGGVHFRVWAPRAREVEVAVLESERDAGCRRVALDKEANGYFAGVCADCAAGALYGFYLNGEERLYPDPMSRFQPQGPHGPSQVVDPDGFSWTDVGWKGLQLRGQVIYEMHVGTFTREGTWRAATEQLAELARLGITVIEVMPVADFPGEFGWGYDGVNLFAPTRLYGSPDDLRSFVNEAHGVGIGVILDVVYNHLGPDGNYLPFFSEGYFRSDVNTDWGSAINFGGEKSGPVREFYNTNAGYWIDEFHLDGLRLDATQDIHDAADKHVLAEISQAVRRAAGRRATIVIAENEPQNVRLVRPLDQGGYGIDGLWNDDFHHSAMVALSGHNEAYYTDYLGKPQEFISAAKYGYLYQGQRYQWQEMRRGTSTRGVSSEAFINFIQNHDQVANSARGWRCDRVSSPGRCRALTALMVLMPGTPMLFQGQEFHSSSPFHFFADHKAELAKKVNAGRKEFMEQFLSVAVPEVQSQLPNPADRATFLRCKLDFTERESHAEAYALHRDLLKLRRDEAVFAAQRAGGVDGAVLAQEAFVLRYFAEEKSGLGDRLLIVNLGRDLELRPAPEPLLAPPEGFGWKVLWSSEVFQYGGGGTVAVESDEGWRLPGQAAVVLYPSEL